MRVLRCTIYAKGYVSKLRLNGDGKLEVNGAKHSFSSWTCDDESITITYAWSREAGYTHIFKLIDEESQMFELETKNGYWIPNPWHTHRSILILNGWERMLWDECRIDV